LWFTSIFLELFLSIFIFRPVFVSKRYWACQPLLLPLTIYHLASYWSELALFLWWLSLRIAKTEFSNLIFTYFLIQLCSWAVDIHFAILTAVSEQDSIHTPPSYILELHLPCFLVLHLVWLTIDLIERFYFKALQCVSHSFSFPSEQSHIFDIFASVNPFRSFYCWVPPDFF
jgi:hypothetical protein